MKFIKEFIIKQKKHLLFFCDLLLWNLSFYIGVVIKANSFSLKGYASNFSSGIIVLNICFASVFLVFRLYDNIWRYADVEDFLYAGVACVVANGMFVLITILMGNNLGLLVYLSSGLMSTLLIFILRMSYKFTSIKRKQSFATFPKKRLLVIGGGEGAVTILREISKSPENQYNPICIVDDDPEKLGKKIGGVTVVGNTDDIPDVCKNENIETILFAISAISPDNKRRILNICSKTNIEVKIIPNVYDLLTANLSVTDNIRQVEVEDLLEREPIVFDTERYGKYIVGQTVLVTGGGGSIGSELCRQIAKINPKCLIILDIYENNAYDIQQELIRKLGNTLNFKVEIASVRDFKKLEKIFIENNIDVVFHAAAHKHVPLMETNPEEAVKNNIFGTLNLCQIADKYGVKKFVQISTDKAVNPTNIMGATKRVCEMIVQMMDKQSETKFVAVRFGNVLGSNGSVIPLFKEQIKSGGPVTVTHPEIIRYFMTIPEAVSLVLTAGGFAKGGEIFILDMGEPVKIQTLAENLIRLSGYTPNVDIKIEYTGLRPGEKLFEELLLDEEGIQKTHNKKIYIGKPIDIDKEKLMENLNKIYVYAQDNNVELLEKMLQEIVPTFTHTKNSKK